MVKFLRLVGWDKYQHYKQRNPPWVKLHRSILQSHAFMMLDDASKLLAFVCIVLAGDSNNMIPLDRDFIQRRANLQKRPDIRPLIKAGFAEVYEDCKQNASDMLAPCNQSDAQRQRQSNTETEADTDGDSAIGIDEATTKVFLELSLGGNESRMLCHDAVQAFVHVNKCSFAEAADSLVSLWREYSAAPGDYKKGVKKFLAEGVWRDPSVWNGKSKWEKFMEAEA